jgi:hypothetical protein
MQKLAYSIRNKQYILENTQPKPIEYTPQLYIKLKHWNPPPATNQIEDQLTHFRKMMERAINHSTNNLTHKQKTLLRELKANKDFIILPTDKNLGPAIVNRADYINQAITEHLLTPDYENLNPTTARKKLTETRDLLIQTYNRHKHSLTEAEIQYFSRSFKQQHRTPIFYGLPKVHKKPIKLRPVVSCINSFTSVFSNWLDYRMKQLLHPIPSYIKDSRDLLKELKSLTIPKGAKLFTADATAMYTNITLENGLEALHNLINTNSNLIPPNFPSALFLTTLEIVMSNNIFTFSDTFWRQLHGTAKGTPAAPLYSILSFGHHENTAILPKFTRNLFYYKRFIDDVFGIWVDTPDQSWEMFKTQLN